MSVSTKMLVPKTITAGFVKREDTYTGKLAYVIYTDAKGVLRKEKSWNGWRDAKIKPVTYDNTPRTGFVLNKKVGGYKSDWNVRQTMVRVYDPHDFEFEISVVNLLFILQETSAIQGKGLEGEFVYAWHGTELVLLPTCSAEYRECVKFTGHQATKVKKEDMVEGCTYIMKDMTNVLYLGRHDYCTKTHDKQFRPVGARHVFLPLDKKEVYDWLDVYVTQTGFDKISAKTSEEASPLYADAYDKFKKSRHCDKVVDVKLSPITLSQAEHRGHVYLLKEEEKYFLVRVHENYSYTYPYGSQKQPKTFSLSKGGEIDISLKNGKFSLPSKPPYSYREGESVHNKELFSATLVTEKGHSFNLSKYT